MDSKSNIEQKIEILLMAQHIISLCESIVLFYLNQKAIFRIGFGIYVNFNSISWLSIEPLSQFR